MANGNAVATPTPGVVGRRDLVAWIGLLLVASAIVSALAGFAGAPNAITWRSFDWQLAAVAGTAFGTIVLAGFTGALAWTTSGDVRATWEVAQLTRTDQEQRIRPSVLIYGRSYEGGGGGGVSGLLRLQVVNAGLGPALKITIGGEYKGDGNVAVASDAQIPYMRPGGTTDEYFIRVNQPEPPAGGVPDTAFLLSGTCTDSTQTKSYDVVDLTAP